MRLTAVLYIMQAPSQAARAQYKSPLKKTLAVPCPTGKGADMEAVLMQLVELVSTVGPLIDRLASALGIDMDDSDGDTEEYESGEEEVI